MVSYVFYRGRDCLWQSFYLPLLHRMWQLIPWPGIKAAPTTLEGRVLATGLPGKFPNLFSFLGSSLTFIDDSLLSNLGFPGRFPDEFLSPSLPRQSLGLFSQSKAIYLLGLNCKNFHFYFILCSLSLSFTTPFSSNHCKHVYHAHGDV